MPSFLDQYAREYVATFNQMLPTLPPSPYTQRLIEARIFPAGNDAVIFFLPEDVAPISPNFLPQTRSGFLPLSPDGLSHAPATDQPLTEVLQAATHNCLKVAIRPDTPLIVGESRELIHPPDLLKEHLLCSGSLHPEWLGVPTDQDIHVTVVGVLPMAEIRNGQIVRELPNKPIYQDKKGAQTAHLTHAMTQVRDWLRYVNDNRDTVRREDKLEGIYRPTGEVIAGKDEHLNEAAQERFDADRADFDRTGIKIRTYDMLLRDIRASATSLARFGTPAPREERREQG